MSRVLILQGSPRREVAFPVGEGNLPAGAFPYLPLGEGAAAAAEEGRYQVGHCTAPHPSGLRPATLSQERVVRSSPGPAGPPSPGRGLRGSPAGEGGGQLT